MSITCTCSAVNIYVIMRKFLCCFGSRQREQEIQAEDRSLSSRHELPNVERFQDDSSFENDSSVLTELLDPESFGDQASGPMPSPIYSFSDGGKPVGQPSDTSLPKEDLFKVAQFQCRRRRVHVLSIHASQSGQMSVLKSSAAGTRRTSRKPREDGLF